MRMQAPGSRPAMQHISRWRQMAAARPASGHAEIDSTLGPLPAAKDCPPSGPAEPVAIRRARYSGGCPAWLRMIPASPYAVPKPRVALTWCYAQLWCSSASSTPSWSGCPAGWYSWCEMTPPRTQRSSCSDTRWQSRGGKSPARKPDWADRDRRLGEASTQPVPCPRRGFPMRSVNWSVGGSNGDGAIFAGGMFNF